MIKIGDYYIRRRDEYNLVLETRYIVKKGKHAGEEKSDVIGFFPKMEHLC